MEPFTDMNDRTLEKRINQLRRDVQDFAGRAAAVARSVNLQGRDPGSDPLYQRLSSIRNFLQHKLTTAEQEFIRRAQNTPTPRAPSFGATLLELCLPWRRVRAPR